MYIYAKRNKMSYPAFLFLDIICITLSFVVAFVVRLGTIDLRDVTFMNIYVQMLLVMVLSHVCIVYVFEMYTNIERRGRYRELKAVLENNMLLMFMFLFYSYVTQQGSQYSRKFYVIFFVINIIFMYVVRMISKHLVQKWMMKTDSMPRLIVLTRYKDAPRVIKSLKQTDLVDYNMKGIVIIDKNMVGKKILGVPVVANRDSVFEYARLAVVDSAFMYMPEDPLEAREFADNFIDMGATVHINVDYVPMAIPNKTVQNIGEFTVISGSMKIATPSQAIVKRSMDIIGGFVGIVFTILLGIVVAPMIYIESPGPILFKQERVGRNGRRFKIYKFRSMYMDAEERKKELMEKNKMRGFMFKMDDDPRITKIGKFIRKTSIDEFPQFWNVLKGDMSLVGTRPPTVDEYEQYEPRHKKRLGMKPGITGMWQVNGRSNVVDFEEVVKMDAEYISKWSIALDIKLLLKTVKVLFGDKDAS